MDYTTTDAAKLTRLVARDELADVCARLAVVVDELNGASQSHAIVASMHLTNARKAVGAAVSHLSRSLGPAPIDVPLCACGHDAEEHTLEVDEFLAWVCCKRCGCPDWQAAR